MSDLSAPLGADQGVAIALRRVMQIRGQSSIAALTRDDTVELYTLHRLLLAPADEAGTLAALFHRPDMMLGIRDEVARMAARRAEHDRNKAVFDATDRLWRSLPWAGGPVGLLLSLQSLETPDPDLWHKVVLEHDPSCPEQRAAALWCVRQRSCDRATVAAFLAAVMLDGRLAAAARRGDRIWLDAVLDVIEAWNSGTYKTQALALSPADCLMGRASEVSQALNALAKITGEACWPEPQGLCVEYKGRAMLPRDNWCVAKGRMLSPPVLPDYIPTYHQAA